MKKKFTDSFIYKNTAKTNKNFMYQNLKRANCYDVDFSGSNFNFTSLRGAHMKSCNFFECSFKEAEFVGTNLKKSRFKKAKFQDTLFEGVNLAEVDFRDAEFENTYFVGTDVTKAKNLDLKNPEIHVFEEMPQMKLSQGLEAAVLGAMENSYVKAARVLDTKEGKINTLSLTILLGRFNEQTLIAGLKLVGQTLDKDFCTLSYLTKFIQKSQQDGIL
ncbi:MAG: pentapeptide repeat-containing protein [Cellulosilyticaceae bacterium]